MSRGRPVDLVGYRKGDFVVLARLASGKGNVYWSARCDCGRTFTVATSAVLGKQLSCGCRRQRLRKPRLCDTPEYVAWAAMKQRCGYEGAASYANYGGRGIRVAAEWINDFAAFLAHVGKKPTPAHSLDRIDSNRNYEPGNVRWATRKEQARNVRDNRLLTYDGRTMPLTAWAEETGLCSRTLFSRVAVYGWSHERALTTPVNRGARKYGYRPDGRRYLVQEAGS